MTVLDLGSAVPAGIPQGLTVGQVARALNLREETVKTALTAGARPLTGGTGLSNDGAEKTGKLHGH